MSGRVALVTGAGSEAGIGFAVARRLARDGAGVAVTSTTERIHGRAAELEAGGAPRLLQTVRGFGYVLREPEIA